MLNNLFINLIAMALAALISYFAKKIWRYIQSQPEHHSNEINPEMTKKQFFGSLLVCVVSFLVRIIFDNSFLKIISTLIFFMSALAIWGAFEAIFYLLKDKLKDKER